LRLVTLEVNGFKSFADPQKLTFPVGMTAVVGPNGCGKSNISDSLAWVLGEQRATLLRGAEMADVIFAGTGQRKPMGMAEVKLTLEMPDPTLPGSTREVVISRRLYRDTGSEYRITGRECRLKDVSALLMDTGMGTRAYSFIQQNTNSDRRLNQAAFDCSGFCNCYGYEIEAKLIRNNLKYKIRYIKNQSLENGVVIPVDAIEYAGIQLNLSGNKSPLRFKLAQ